jgi:hypothetical protein
MARTKLLFVGNCQKTLMTSMAGFLGKNLEANLVHASHLQVHGPDQYRHLLDESDIVFSQPLIGEEFGDFEQEAVLASTRNVIYFPSIVFCG